MLPDVQGVGFMYRYCSNECFAGKAYGGEEPTWRIMHNPVEDYVTHGPSDITEAARQDLVSKVLAMEDTEESRRGRVLSLELEQG